MNRLGKVLWPLPAAVVSLAVAALLYQIAGHEVATLGIPELLAFAGIFTTIVLFLWRRMDQHAMRLDAKLSSEIGKLYTRMEADYRAIGLQLVELTRRSGERDIADAKERGGMLAEIRRNADGVLTLRGDLNGLGSKLSDRYSGLIAELQSDQRELHVAINDLRQRLAAYKGGRT